MSLKKSWRANISSLARLEALQCMLGKVGPDELSRRCELLHCPQPRHGNERGREGKMEGESRLAAFTVMSFYGPSALIIHGFKATSDLTRIINT